MIVKKIPDWKEPIKIYQEGDHWIFKLLFSQFAGITWMQKICYRKRCHLSESSIRHEQTHVIQQKELGNFLFYLLYLSFWLFNILKVILFPITYILKACKVPINIGGCYRNIPFEIEAYTNQNDNKFLLNRKKNNWKQYIIQKRRIN